MIESDWPAQRTADAIEAWASIASALDLQTS